MLWFPPVLTACSPPSLSLAAHLTISFRISPAIDTRSLLPSLTSLDPRQPEVNNVNMMPGTRRLDHDVTEYEYVDTYPRYADIIIQKACTDIVFAVPL